MSGGVICLGRRVEAEGLDGEADVVYDSDIAGSRGRGEGNEC